MESASAVANLEFGIYPIKKCVGRQSNFGIESSYAVSGLVVDVLVTVAAVIAGAQLARVVLSSLSPLRNANLAAKKSIRIRPWLCLTNRNMKQDKVRL